MFFKFSEDDGGWHEDKSDVDTHNNTSFVYNSNLALVLEQQRIRLPIHKYKEHILYLLENYQTVVLVGETGCGKSTQIPQVCFYFSLYLWIANYSYYANVVIFDSIY